MERKKIKTDSVVDELDQPMGIYTIEKYSLIYSDESYSQFEVIIKNRFGEYYKNICEIFYETESEEEKSGYIFDNFSQVFKKTEVTTRYI